MRTIQNGKLAGETSNIFFNFGTRLAVGETISSASVTCAVYSGTDASPSSVISGSATISGAQVTQKVTGGTLGVTYKLVCTANTSASQVLLLTSFLVIVPDTE